MIALLANVADVAEALKIMIDTREAIIGWARANMDVVNTVRDAHNHAALVRGSL